MKLKTGYCPICDKEIKVRSDKSMCHCSVCGHDIVLHDTDEDKGEKMSDLKNIYLITVFDKCEPTDDSWGYDIGCTRSVGWRPTFEMAEEAVKTNMCDIWEYCYDYACIEELDYSLYPWADNRWFYKFNRKTGNYEEIDEPVFLKNHGPIGGIG